MLCCCCYFEQLGDPGPSARLTQCTNDRTTSKGLESERKRGRSVGRKWKEGWCQVCWAGRLAWWWWWWECLGGRLHTRSAVGQRRPLRGIQLLSDGSHCHCSRPGRHQCLSVLCPAPTKSTAGHPPGVILPQCWLQGGKNHQERLKRGFHTVVKIPRLSG